MERSEGELLGSGLLKRGRGRLWVVEGEFDGGIVLSLEDEGSFSGFLLTVESVKKFGCGCGCTAIGDSAKFARV